MRYARYASHTDHSGDTDIDNRADSIPSEVVLQHHKRRGTPLPRCDDRYKVCVAHRRCEPRRSARAVRLYIPNRLRSVSEMQTSAIIATVNIRRSLSRGEIGCRIENSRSRNSS